MTKGEIFQIKFSQSDEKYDQSVVMQILQEFGTL